MARSRRGRSTVIPGRTCVRPRARICMTDVPFMSRETLQFEGRDGLRLVADRWGDPADRPIVFLHGGGQTRHSWGGAAASVAQRGWQALTLDARGHGESDWSDAGDYRLVSFAEDLRLVVVATRPAAGARRRVARWAHRDVADRRARTRQRARCRARRHRPRHGRGRRGTHPGLHGGTRRRGLRFARGSRRHGRGVQPASGADHRRRRASQEPARTRRPLLLALGPALHGSRRRDDAGRDPRHRPAARGRRADGRRCAGDARARPRQ